MEVAAVKRGDFGDREPLGNGDDSRVRRIRQVRAGLGKRRSAEDAGDSGQRSLGRGVTS
jgi:hypothetical protein